MNSTPGMQERQDLAHGSQDRHGLTHLQRPLGAHYLFQ